MNFIRVVSRKIPNSCGCDIIPLYVNQLSENVKTQDGFLGSHSFWDLKTEEIYSMSDWKSIDHWNKWIESETRNSIKKQFETSIKDEQFQYFLKRKNQNDIFLL
jgi:heme-degrading monooxygenase HmoA